MSVIPQQETAVAWTGNSSLTALAAVAPPATRPLAPDPPKLRYKSSAAARISRCSFLTSQLLLSFPQAPILDRSASASPRSGADHLRHASSKPRIVPAPGQSRPPIWQARCEALSLLHLQVSQSGLQSWRSLCSWTRPHRRSTTPQFCEHRPALPLPRNPMVFARDATLYLQEVPLSWPTPTPASESFGRPDPQQASCEALCQHWPTTSTLDWTRWSANGTRGFGQEPEGFRKMV